MTPKDKGGARGGAPVEYGSGVPFIPRDSSENPRTAAEVRESEARLSAILDTVSDGIVTIDETGNIGTFNRAAEAIFGYRAEEVVGRNVAVLMPAALAAHHDQHIERYQRGAPARVIGIGREDIGRRKTGEEFPMDLTVNEMRLGGRRHYVGVIRDISERKAAQRAQRESEERYALAMRGTNDGLWDWSLVSKRIYASPRLCEMLGRSAEELASPKAWEKVIHPDHYALYRRKLTEHLRGDSDFLSVDFRVVPATERPDEQWVRLRGAAQRDDTGRAIRLAGSLSDITERRKERERLRLAKEEAEIASRTKSEFLANMSHELRTPLNAIIGFSEVIENELFGPVGQARYRDYATNIMDSGRHLLDIINDILDVARIEAGKIDLTPVDVDLAAIARAALRLVGERAKTGKILLHADLAPGLPPVRGDERRVKQVIINILSNAVKFTPEGGSVTVGLRADGPDAQAVTIRDTGIGMRPEDIPIVMRPFGQLDGSLSRKYEGTGLGLPLTKAFMELHGGTLRIDSAVGEGTVVTLRFPIDGGPSFPPPRQP